MTRLCLSGVLGSASFEMRNAALSALDHLPEVSYPVVPGTVLRPAESPSPQSVKLAVQIYTLLRSSLVLEPDRTGNVANLMTLIQRRYPTGRYPR